MRLKLSILVLLIIALQLLFAPNCSAQSIADEKVTLGLADDSLITAIKQIEQQSIFRFFYRSADIKPVSHLSLPTGTRTIQQTLDMVLQNTQLSFRQIDGNILLERKNIRGDYEISGRVVDSADKKPIANVSAFINNSTIGIVTGKDGTFKLNVKKTGKYELVISIIGYAPYRRWFDIGKQGVKITDIQLAQEIIQLSEVKIKPDPNWVKYYKLFKEQFLGNSAFAKKCRILNAEVLDFDYNKKSGLLTASSSGLLEIENEALGYNIKYLLTRFSYNRNNEEMNYNGFAVFETKEGDKTAELKWQKSRLKTYKGSPMHFLRAALENRLDQEGFVVLRLKKKPIPGYPGKYIDSLGDVPVAVNDFVCRSNKKDIYALKFKNCLYVMYTKLHNNSGNLESIPSSMQPSYAKTTVTITTPFVLFDDNGIILNPENVVYQGYWTGGRMAVALPSDYNPDN